MLALTQTWLRNEPHHPEAWIAHGNALKQLGDANAASQALARATTIYAILEQPIAQRIWTPNALTALAK